MSIELDVMNFLLGLASDSSDPPPTMTRIGREPADKISETQLPLVQVFAPVVDVAEEAAQKPGTLTVVLEIVDVQGQKDALREVLEALDNTLRIDSSFQGLVRKGFVAARAVAEVGDDKRTLASATIVCEVHDRLLATPFTDVVDLSAAPGTFGPVNGVVESSKIITGSLGIRRAVASSGALTVAADVIGGVFDLSTVSRLRALSYATSEYGRTAIANPTLALIAAGSSATYTPASEGTNMGVGWVHSLWDIDSPPDAEVGGGIGDRSAITAVRLSWAFFFAASFTSTRFGIIWSQAGYHQRDAGTGAISGFHSDI